MLEDKKTLLLFQFSGRQLIRKTQKALCGNWQWQRICDYLCPRPGPLSVRLARVDVIRHPCQNAVMSSQENLPDWERLLAAERHLQYLIPGTILVGGTAAAIHAQHRTSMDGDHVLEDLRERFDDVLATLEAVSGWQTERVQRPVIILGQLDGILTGIRQLRRTVPLETEIVAGLRVPTLPEMARIKAWLLVTRNTVRDFLDTIVLFERLGEERLVEALRSFDAICRQSSGASPLAELSEGLAAAAPKDRAEIDLKQYRGLRPPWNDWQYLTDTARQWAAIAARIALQE